jgi:hypothetical protein
MARAGFTAIHSGRIKFGKDAAGTATARSSNKAICRLYAKAMTIDDMAPRGSAWAGTRRRSTSRHAVGGHAGRGRAGARFTVVLNDDSASRSIRRRLSVGGENVLYCRVKDGRHAARFLRPPATELHAARPARPGDQLELPVGGRRIPLG